MIPINKTLKFSALFLICILLLGQLHPNINSPTHAESNSPVELKISHEADYLSVGDLLELKIHKADEELQQTSIDLPENLSIDEDSIEHLSADQIDFNQNTNNLIIHWDMIENISELTIDLITVDAGDVEISAHNLVKDEVDLLMSNSIYFTVESTESDEYIKPSIPKEEGKEEQITDETATEEEDGHKKEDEANQAEEAIIDKNSLDTEENSIKEENEEDPTETYEIKSTANSSSVNVGNWDSFVAALEDPTIEEIIITSNFSSNGLTKEFPVNGDKAISGGQYTIDFHRHRINIDRFNVIVKDLTIEADQIATNNKASVFYSDHPNGVLHLENTSFNGIQHAQVAKLENGLIIISGKATFQTSGPFEVFEAKNITFNDNSEFVGVSTQTGSSRKEVINLYNSPTIIVGKNASVRLETIDRTSIINVEDNSPASIEVQENGKLVVYAANNDIDRGEALIDLPGEDSSISLAQDAVLDIQNHREGNRIAGLLRVNGTIAINNTLSKVAIWDEGSDTDLESGNSYLYFPRILDGELTLKQNGNFDGTIVSGSAGGGSTLAISDSPEKTGKTFEETFSNIDTSEIKRLLISPAEKPLKPVSSTLTDQDRVLTGTSSPNVTIKVSSTENDNTMTTTTDDAGDFSISLDDGPYKAGTEFQVIAIDSFGIESEVATFSVTGTILSLTAPSTMAFQPAVVESEVITIPRQDEDWSIRVQDTREQGAPWSLTAKAESPLSTSDGHTLSEDALIFNQDGNDYSLKDSVSISKGTKENSEETNIEWGENEGVLLKLNPEGSNVRTNTEYSTTIEWTLTDAP